MSRDRAVFAEPVYALALAAVGLAIRPDAATAAADSPMFKAGTGDPTEVRGVAGGYVKMNPSSLNDVLWLTDGATWEAVPLDAGDDAFDDTATYYTVDTIKAALAALAGQIGGTSDAAYTFATTYVLANNDALYAALAKVDAAFGAALATLTTTSKTLVGSINEVDAAVIAAQADATQALADAATAQAQANQASEQIVPMAVLGAWAIDGDGAETNGAGLVGVTPTLTEAAPGQCVIEDGGVFANLAASAGEGGYTSAYQIFPDVPADGDAIYFGASVQFCELALDIAVAQASTGNVFTWEYWDSAAWQALTLAYDGTGVTATGARSFERDGAISLVPPADWAQNTVNGGTLFWIRCRVTTVANIGIALGTTNSKQHEIVTPNGGFLARQTGTITTLRIVDGAGTLHTTADVKFIVMNYTSGSHSGELTFAQDVRAQRYTGLSLAVTAGDILGVVVTQEDGSAEPSGVILELGFTVA